LKADGREHPTRFAAPLFCLGIPCQADLTNSNKGARCVFPKQRDAAQNLPAFAGLCAHSLFIPT
jgi:hypothetical protein